MKFKWVVRSGKWYYILNKLSIDAETIMRAEERQQMWGAAGVRQLASFMV